MKKPKKRISLLKITAILLAVSSVLTLTLTVLVAVSLFSRDRFTGAVLLTVPPLTGEPLPHGFVRENPFFQTVVREVYDGARPGTVIAQDPPPGSVRKAVRGRRYVTLSLTVSKGPRTAVVPRVVGLSEEEARTVLLSDGFSPRLTSVFSSRPRGEILSAEPPSGANVAFGSSVTLTVSKGPENPLAAVPDLSGLTPVMADSLLSSVGLTLGGIVYKAVDRDGGRVVGQSAPHGVCLPRGTAVGLTVSRLRTVTEEESEKAPDTAGTLEGLLERLRERKHRSYNKKET